MNKNIAILMVIALCNTVALPVTKSEARTIRKDLYANYADNKLTYVQLAEPGLTMSEIVDRDLQIMIEHRDVLQSKLDGYKGFFVRVLAPGWNKAVAGGAGTVSLVTGLFAVIGSDWASKVWKGDLKVWFADKAINTRSFFGALTQKDVLHYNIERATYLNGQNPGLMEVTALVPVAAVVSVITGLLCIKGMYNLCTHKGKVATQMQKIQKRLNRDQAIIGQLKEAKYQLAQ